MPQKYAVAGIEPPLQELLDDHIARLLMERDGIGLGEVWRAVETARSGLAATTQRAVDESRGVAPAPGLPATRGR